MVLQELTGGGSVFGSWEIVLSLGLFAASVAGLLVYALTRKVLSYMEASALLFLGILISAFAFLPEQVVFEKSFRSIYNYYSAVLTNTGVLWAVVFNLLIFFELLGVIFSGYRRKESWLINIGMVGLFMLIAFKYFDWFFTFLDKSLFFIGAGVLLLVIGWFMERNRRRLIADIKAV